jgi:hypothetical protein
MSNKSLDGKWYFAHVQVKLLTLVMGKCCQTYNNIVKLFHEKKPHKIVY